MQVEGLTASAAPALHTVLSASRLCSVCDKLLRPLEWQQGETEPHRPAQTTRCPQLPNLLDLGFAFSLVLIISPQG